jgi:hypothetical protein
MFRLSETYSFPLGLRSVLCMKNINHGPSYGESGCMKGLSLHRDGRGRIGAEARQAMYFRTYASLVVKQAGIERTWNKICKKLLDDERCSVNVA